MYDSANLLIEFSFKLELRGVFVQATVTNDYHECEKWAKKVIDKLPQFLGLELFNGFVNEVAPVAGPYPSARRSEWVFSCAQSFG